MTSFSFMIKLMVVFTVVVIFLRTCNGTEQSATQPLSYLSDPVQTNSREKAFSYGKYTITPLADFHIKAKVLSRERYHFGREADLSPVDFALGWGRMTDENVLKTIDISQSNRWYHWRSKSPSIPIHEINTHSANMHMIPKDEILKDRLLEVKEKDIVTIKGVLVRVDATDGWHWTSSMSRKDSGSGACEIVFVKSIQIEAKY